MQKKYKLIYDLFEPIVSQKVQKSYSGFGSFIAIQFGMNLISLSCSAKKIFDIRSEWYFWVDMSFWDLKVNGKIATHDDDKREKIDHTVKKLEGKRLLNVEILSDEYDMMLVFENGISLHLIANNRKEDYKQWSLFTPDKMILTAGPLEKLTYKSEDEPSED